MDKPLVLVMNDFRENFAKLINESGIPVGVIVDMLKSMIPALETAAEEEYRGTLQAYLKETENNKLDNKQNTEK